jgi:hypothetical protein
MISKLSIGEIQNKIEGKTFEEVKECLKKDELTVRENQELYLVVSNDNTDKLKRECNGLVFEKGTNRLIVANQNKMIDIDDNIVVNENMRVEYCEDGTIIRLYHYNGKWNTATTKCIDARDSFWSSNKTFDEMFWELFDMELLEKLNKNSTYIFVLLHPENNIVVRHKYAKLVYLLSINTENLIEDYRNVFYGNKKFKRPYVISDVNVNLYNPYKRGIIYKVYNYNDKSWVTYKLDFEQYKMVKNIRGNVPDIAMRMLELLKDPDQLRLLELYYPEYAYIFGVYKMWLSKLINDVYKCYVESHIKHNVQVSDDHKFFQTLRQLHGQYKKTQKAINRYDVQDKIFNLDKRVIMNLLKYEINNVSNK